MKLRFRRKEKVATIWVCMDCGHLSEDTKEERSVATLPFLVANQEVTGILSKWSCTVCPCINHGGFINREVKVEWRDK